LDLDLDLGFGGSFITLEVSDKINYVKLLYKLYILYLNEHILEKIMRKLFNIKLCYFLYE